MIEKYEAFLKDVREKSKLLKERIEAGGKFLVVSHIDADGLSSGGIFSYLLYGANVTFTTRVVQQIEESLLEEISSLEDVENVVFLDLGSGYKTLLSKYKFEDKWLMVIDHHPPEKGVELENLVEVNPNLFGVDGTREISSSVATYFIVSSLDSTAKKLSGIALCGAVGDRQDAYKKRAFSGLNRMVLEEAMESGIVERKMGLALFGAETRPLVKALEYTLDPYLPGLTGNPSNCYIFLKKNCKLKIEGEKGPKSLNDLTPEEVQRLVSELVKYLLKSNVSHDVIDSLVGYNYVLEGEEKHSPLRDLREFSSLLNACGRLGKPSLGILLSMGVRHAKVLEEAQKVISEYRAKISKSMGALERDGRMIQRKTYANYVLAGSAIDYRVIGTVVSILCSSNLVERDKPVVGLAKAEGGKIKVSARLPRSLQGKVDIGEVLSVVAQKVGGVGGGHDVAAGALIPDHTEEYFVSLMEEELERRIRSARA